MSGWSDAAPRHAAKSCSRSRGVAVCSAVGGAPRAPGIQKQHASEGGWIPAVEPAPEDEAAAEAAVVEEEEERQGEGAAR